MPADQYPPAENHEHASSDHPAEERPDPVAFAHQLLGHLADVHGEASADLYLAKVIAEVLELSPVAREHISDLILVELTQELGKRGEEEAMRAVLKAQRDWAQGA